MFDRNFLETLFVSVVLSFSISASSTEAASADGPSNTEYWAPVRPPKAHYRIDCSIDAAKGLLEGKEIVFFRNTASRPIHRLAVGWPSYTGENLEIIGSGKPVSILTEPTSTHQLLPSVIFQLPEPVGPGEKAKLEFKFTRVKPARTVGDTMGFLNWHPRLWWGFETHDDFDVKVKTPNEFKVVTSGVLDSESGFYHAKGIRLFGLILFKGLNVVEAGANDVLVRVVFSSKAQKCSKVLLSTAVDAINFYRERFGFYPSTSLTIVPGPAQWSGGCPVATNIVAIHGMERVAQSPESRGRWITAHEIGHQYWGEYVLAKDSDGLDWLMIGLGLYADREYAQVRGLGPQRRQAMMNRYIKGVRRGIDTTINRSPEERAKVKFDFNMLVTHGKGYSVISALDCVLGRKLFERIYRRCLKEFAGRTLDVYKFRAVCEEESGQDLGWFFEQWVNSNKYLSYEIYSKKCEQKGNSYISEVQVKCLGDLKMPVPVAAYFEDGSSQVKFTDRVLDTNILKFESASKLKELRIDPDKKLALVIPPPAPTEAELAKMVQKIPWTKAGKQALDAFEKANESRMTNADSWFKLGLTLYDGKYYSEAMEAFRKTHSLAEKTSYRYSVSLVWQGHILDLLGQRKQALSHYERVLKEGTDFEVRHDQYGMVIDREWVEKRIKKPFQRR